MIACKGKKVTRFDLRAGSVDEDALANAVLGPTGNLRAPAMRVGRRFIVGFGEDTFRQYLLGK